MKLDRRHVEKENFLLFSGQLHQSPGDLKPQRARMKNPNASTKTLKRIQNSCL